MITFLDHVLSKNIQLNIYGAGKRASLVFDFLKELGMTELISFFIVNKKTNNPEEIDGIQVCLIGDECVDRINCATVIALADRVEARKVQNELYNAGFRDVWRIVNWDFSQYALYIAAKKYFESLDSHIVVRKLVTDEYEFCHVLVKRSGRDRVGSIASVRDDKEGKFRFYYTILAPQVRVREAFFEKNRMLEEFKEYYGSYLTLGEAVRSISEKSFVERGVEHPNCDASGNGSNEKKFRIFRAVCASDTFSLICPIPDYVTTVQAGAALTDVRISNHADDIGENISHLNRDFSECTVLYWMWKNVHDADYLGLFHFARFMDIPNGNLQAIVDAGIDIVVTTPMIVGSPIREFFCPRYIPSKDWRLMEKALLKHYPEYKQTLDRYNEAFCYPGANLSIMRKNVFEEYAEFVFTVTMDIAGYYESQGIVRNDRYAGYLCENLTALFVMHHKDDLRIAYTDLLYVKDLS